MPTASITKNQNYGVMNESRLHSNSNTSNTFQSIAPPRKLRVDQILTRSIIISWVTPSSESLDFVIDEYRILVDGKLRTIVEGTQTNAVIENIERKPDKVYKLQKVTR